MTLHDLLYLGGAVAMTVAPLAFILVYFRTVDWRNPISQNVMALAGSVLLFGAVSLTIRLRLIPADWSRPLLVVANWAVALVFVQRTWQLWQVTHPSQPARPQEADGDE